MAQKVTKPETAQELSDMMQEMFATVANDLMSLDKAKVIQNHSAKIMTIQMGQLAHDKFYKVEKPIPFWGR